MYVVYDLVQQLLPSKPNNTYLLMTAELDTDVNNIKVFQFCRGNATMGSLCIVVELQNISYSC